MGVSPIVAAKDLKIPTATFIFSWDNLPKATIVIETDYYFVWSNLMKEQLLFYYSYIQPENIFVVGTPQFEHHFKKQKLIDKKTFFRENNLDINKKYVCFSGDDFTSSPDDPEYLKDTANAITKLNNEGNNFGIIFRRCPTDVSGRYNNVIKTYKDIITEIKPKWKNIGNEWNTILPMKEDMDLLSNTIHHSEIIMNLGSSMVFDAVALKKPCAYFNYNQEKKINPSWDIHKSYNYVHFRSMPNKNAIVWLNSTEEIAQKIKKGIQDNKETVEMAKEWFSIVNNFPKNSSEKIWEAINKI